MTKQAKKIQRKLKGLVVSNKMTKTIVVKVTRFKKHPKYQKRYKIDSRYKVHDEKNQAQIGDLVVFQECRPLSKDKKWRLLSIVKVNK